MMSRKLTLIFLTAGLALTGIFSSAMAGVMDYAYTYDPTGGAPLPSASTPSWTLTRPAGTGDALEVAGELFSWDGPNGSPSNPMSTPGNWNYALDNPAANGVTPIDSAGGFVFEERFEQDFESGGLLNSMWGQAVFVGLENTAQTQFYRVAILHTEQRIYVYDLLNDNNTEIRHFAGPGTFVTAKYTFKDGNLDVVWDSGGGPSTPVTIALASTGSGSPELAFGSYTSSNVQAPISVDYYAWSAIPEPTTFGLMGLGSLVMMVRRRRM
ncbi:MAG: PEP-CTERM sorting domain-containing protein [Planctomycetes bacterium]|nr:PEP-CTERM sorting domain-containing protein [Planctomycetota bacterium]